MKVIKESNFEPDNLLNHVEEHKKQYLYDSRFRNVKTENQFNSLYNSIGDKLSRIKVGSSLSDNRFVGYIDKKNRYIKYDRKYQDFVVYSGKFTITLHKKTYQQYLNIRRRDFKSEMPYNK